MPTRGLSRDARACGVKWDECWCDAARKLKLSNFSAWISVFAKLKEAAAKRTSKIDSETPA